MMKQPFDTVSFVDRYIKEQGLLGEGEKVLIAVSGGADSVFLLYALQKLSLLHNWKLYVGHINHNLRAEESDEDERFVCQLAEQFRIPFQSVRIHVAEKMEETGRSLQELARELRYQALADMARQFDVHLVATAHHADDQAETILHRLLRGTSTQGLGGISPSRAWPYSLPVDHPLRLIRPLLKISRRQIEDELSKFGASYRNDSSNALMKYSRNKIRLHLLPILAEGYNPKIVDTLSTLAEIMRDESDFLEEEARRQFEEVVVRKKDEILLDRRRFSRMAIALQRRVIKLILYYLEKGLGQLQFTHIESMRDIALNDNPHARLHLPHGIFVRRDYEVIHISFVQDPYEDVRSPDRMSDVYEIAVPGTTDIAQLQVRIDTEVIPFSCKDLSQVSQADSPSTVWFDYTELANEPLHIRSRRPGDRVRLIGMSGTKRVKDILNEARVTLDRRANWPILVHQDRILWVVGLRRSNAFPITESTRIALRVNVTPLETK